MSGKLPQSFVRTNVENSYIRGNTDYIHTWVQPSHFYFCQGGGLGVFFEFLKRQTLQPGTLLGVYSGRSNKSAKLAYQEALIHFKTSDYVLAYGPARYVVDGQDGDTICGPAKTNDNFKIVNSYLNWNPVNKYMELITMGTLREVLYEALTNYDTPCYWDKTRQDLLPEAS